MTEMEALVALARHMGVSTHYTDGLGREVEVSPETLVRVCASLGAPLRTPAQAADALASVRACEAEEALSPVVVAWDGILPPVPVHTGAPETFRLELEDGSEEPVELLGSEIRAAASLPLGYHTLHVKVNGRDWDCTVISAPVKSWRRPDGPAVSWGLGTHLAALRSRRSRSVGDLTDLERVCRWVGSRGGDLVTVLPLLPGFNQDDAEPSPYSPVSRLFWSELVLDLGDGHVPVGPVDRLDVTAADDEVRAALASWPAPDTETLDPELLRYARFRGAQKRLGRNWRDWPAAARAGELDDEHVDEDEARYHLTAQVETGRQLGNFQDRLDGSGVRLGLDLAVGVHPDGYDTWSRQELFARGMSVGAPPDGGFPSGQDWGFPPVHPGASRQEGHGYMAASIAHQAALCGVLRVDHIMAWTRLYWIPHGLPLSEGTYVSYPAEELFAILTLESHRNQCEVVGENLGTVPQEIREALEHHGIWGMVLAIFEARAEPPLPPGPSDIALIGTHDTPTFNGWVDGVDIDERVRCGLLAAEDAPGERESRTRDAHNLAHLLERDPEDRRSWLGAILEWLGESPSPLVVLWIEDLWLESEGVNLPGTASSVRPNFQRAMGRLLDEVLADPDVTDLVDRLQAARTRAT